MVCPWLVQSSVLPMLMQLVFYSEYLVLSKESYKKRGEKRRRKEWVWEKKKTKRDEKEKRGGKKECMRVSQKNESIKGISYIREGVNRGEEKER